MVRRILSDSNGRVWRCYPERTAILDDIGSSSKPEDFSGCGTRSFNASLGASSSAFSGLVSTTSRRAQNHVPGQKGVSQVAREGPSTKISVMVDALGNLVERCRASAMI